MCKKIGKCGSTKKVVGKNLEITEKNLGG